MQTALIATIGSARVLPISYLVWRGRRQPWFDSPPQKRKVRDRRIQRPAANAVLTTVMDTSGSNLDAGMPEKVIWPAQADCGGLVWTRASS